MSTINLSTAISNIQAARQALAKPIGTIANGLNGTTPTFATISNLLRGATLRLLGFNSQGTQMFTLGKGGQNFGVLQVLNGSNLKGLVNINGLNNQFSAKLGGSGQGILGNINGNGLAAGSFSFKNGFKLDQLSGAINVQGSINEQYYKQFGQNGPIIFGSIDGNGQAFLNYDFENGFAKNIDGNLIAQGGIISYQNNFAGNIGNHTTYQGHVRGPSLYGVAGYGEGGLYAGVNFTALDAAGRVDYNNGKINAYAQGQLKIADLQLGVDGNKVNFKFSPIVASASGGLTYSDDGVDTTIGGRAGVGLTLGASGGVINEDKDGDGLRELGFELDLGLGIIDLGIHVETEIIDKVVDKVDNVVEDAVDDVEDFVKDIGGSAKKLFDKIF